MAKKGELEFRPWGHYRVIGEAENHKVKRVTVYPGARLSLQRHRLREEHWFIVQGEGLVSREGVNIRVLEGESVDIPRGAFHRILNTGKEELVFIEVQTGDYFGEDDIERTADDYGRA